MKDAGLKNADIWGLKIGWPTCLSLPRTILVLASKIQPPEEPLHPGRRGMAGHPSRLVGQPRGESSVGDFYALFIHVLSHDHIPCWYCWYLLPSFHRENTEARRRQDLLAGHCSLSGRGRFGMQVSGAKAPVFNVASQRQRQQPLVKPNGSSHGCRAPHSLCRLTREGMKLFASNNNPSVPCPAR